MAGVRAGEDEKGGDGVTFNDIHNLIGGPKFVELCDLPHRPSDSREASEDFKPSEIPQTSTTHSEPNVTSEAGTFANVEASLCRKLAQKTYAEVNSCHIHKADRVHCNMCGGFFLVSSLEIAVREMAKELAFMKKEIKRLEGSK